jgi:hypothetical protein
MVDYREKLKRIVSDPAKWIETFCFIVNKDSVVVPFKLNPQQRYFIRNMGKYNIVLKSRQIGITSIAEAYSLYLCSTQSNVTCMIMADNDDNLNMIFGKLKSMYNNMLPIARIPTVKNNRKELEFINGSKIICTVCGRKEKARGSTLRYCHLSEVATMNDSFENQMAAIQQAMVANGQLVLESTAHGLNHFHERWQKAVNQETPMWKPFFFSWVDDHLMHEQEINLYAQMYERQNGRTLALEDLDQRETFLLHKGATKKQLMWRRLKIQNDGEDVFRQEFPATPMEAFISTGANVFSSDLVYDALLGVDNVDKKKLPSKLAPMMGKWFRSIETWKLPVKAYKEKINDSNGKPKVVERDAEKYYIGVDSAEGLGGENDYSVISVLDSSGFQCMEFRSNKIKPYEFTDLVIEIAKFYNHALLVIEKASAGHIVLDRVLNDHHYTNVYKYKDYDQRTRKAKRTKGWETNAKSKPIMIQDMIEFFETGLVIINSKTLLNEMKLYQAIEGKGGVSFNAPSGCHDDCLMAMAMAIQGLKSGQWFFSWKK